MNVKIKRLHPDAFTPRYARHGDAGFDLYSTEDVIIEPGETKLIPTGLAFEIPPGFEMQIRPRSGISLKTKLRVANSPGTIDSGYRGEVKVMFENIGCDEIYRDGRRIRYVRNINENGVKIDEYVLDGSYIIRKGDRIAQGVIAPVIRTEFEEVSVLSETERGVCGFGSTGI